MPIHFILKAEKRKRNCTIQQVKHKLCINHKIVEGHFVVFHPGLSYVVLTKHVSPRELPLDEKMVSGIELGKKPIKLLMAEGFKAPLK